MSMLCKGLPSKRSMMSLAAEVSPLHAAANCASQNFFRLAGSDMISRYMSLTGFDFGRPPGLRHSPGLAGIRFAQPLFFPLFCSVMAAAELAQPWPAVTERLGAPQRSQEASRLQISHQQRVIGPKDREFALFSIQCACPRVDMHSERTRTPFCRMLVCLEHHKTRSRRIGRISGKHGVRPSPRRLLRSAESARR